jgi:hypothetical protein
VSDAICERTRDGGSSVEDDSFQEECYEYRSVRTIGYIFIYNYIYIIKQFAYCFAMFHTLSNLVLTNRGGLATTT